MLSNQVVKKLENKVKQKRIELLNRAKNYSRRKDDWYRERANLYKTEASKLNIRNITALSYRSRSNYFTNSSGSCEFNPETMHAHSYRWYDLFKVIKGVPVLNTYGYSRQTSQHVSKMHNTLKALGIKYKTLEAPRGLQSLENALSHELACVARALINEKYSRGNKKPEKYFVNRMLKFNNAELKMLAKFGFKASKARRLTALAQAEESRALKNARIRERAALKRAAEKIQVISDYANKLHGMTDGSHLVKTSDWAWDLETKTIRDEKRRRGRSTFQWEREQAVRDGVTKIYVHSEEPRHLSIVSSS